MARSFTPKDAYTLMNALVKQATGQQAITATDTSSFVSAGETVLATGTENTLNSLSILIGRTLVAARPYSAKLKLMSVDTGAYSNRMRKISFYTQDALPDGSHNTDLFTNLLTGYTNGQNTEASPTSTKSMWEQHPPVAAELNFGGSSVWQDCITLYDDQVKVAFRNPDEFAKFINGALIEHANDLEQQKEEWNRMALINKIGSVVDMTNDMPGSLVNLTSAFNTRFSTNYSTSDLQTTYLKDFLAFFVSQFKLYSDFMAERSLNYHWSPAKTVNGVSYNLLRHTPKNKQHAYLYSPLFTEAESLVLPQIFNPEYLSVENYEPVTFWQAQNSRSAINVTPAITDTSTGTQTAGSAVSLAYVVGMITDADGLMTNFQLDRADTTPLEARKHYRNTWNSYMKNVISDNTENCVVFYMAD